MLLRLLTSWSLHRQDAHRAEILLRLDREDRPLAQHKRVEDVPAILVLEDACLPTPRGLVPLLRSVDFVIPSRPAGIRQHPCVEQCLCNYHCARRRGCGSIVGAGGWPEGTKGGRARRR